MKKIFFMAMACLMAFVSCQEQNRYTIKGTAEGLADGDTIYLQDWVDNHFIKVDSTVLKGGSFEFTGTPDSTTLVRYVAHVKDNVRMLALVFMEKGTINVELKQQGSKVSGTLCNDEYQLLTERLDSVKQVMREVAEKMSPDKKLTEQQRSEVEAEFEQKGKDVVGMLLATTEKNIGNAMGAQSLLTFGMSFTPEQVLPLIEKMPAAYLSNEEIVAIKEYFQTLEKTWEGKKYVDFTLSTPDGKDVKLSDYVSKNKYTLIDFWASWCGPCRAEMPSVVELYKQYKSKGLGIVGVSLDNNLDSWKKGIADLGITWPQMSDLKGWQNEAAQLYGIRSIPHTILISQDGTIVKRDLRGNKLLREIANLLN